MVWPSGLGFRRCYRISINQRVRCRTKVRNDKIFILNSNFVLNRIVLMRLEDQEYSRIAELVHRKAAGVAVATGHSPCK